MSLTSSAVQPSHSPCRSPSQSAPRVGAFQRDLVSDIRSGHPDTMTGPRTDGRSFCIMPRAGRDRASSSVVVTAPHGTPTPATIRVTSCLVRVTSTPEAVSMISLIWPRVTVPSCGSPIQVAADRPRQAANDPCRRVRRGCKAPVVDAAGRTLVESTRRGSRYRCCRRYAASASIAACGSSACGSSSASHRAWRSGCAGRARRRALVAPPGCPWHSMPVPGIADGRAGRDPAASQDGRSRPSCRPSPGRSCRTTGSWRAGSPARSPSPGRRSAAG